VTHHLRGLSVFYRTVGLIFQFHQFVLELRSFESGLAWVMWTLFSNRMELPRAILGLHGTCSIRWIGRVGFTEWPARSPDLTPLHFFLWGYFSNDGFTLPNLNLWKMSETELPGIFDILFYYGIYLSILTTC
jgi:hypothetical protein